MGRNRPDSVRLGCPVRCRARCLMLLCVTLAGCMPPSADDAAPQRSSAPERKSLMQSYTREVKDASKELAAPGTQEGTPHLEQTNVIRYPFDAALDLRSKAAKIQIQSAVTGFYAINGRYPKDYAEFKREILDANPSLKLPELPYYQDYGYDVDKHELIILEYPDRKNQPH